MTTPHDGDEPHQHPQPSGLAATTEHYTRWGWQVLRADDRLLLTTDDTVSAVEMPSGIAAEVQHYLTVRLLAAPVIILPGAPTRWLLLTSSANDSTPVGLIRLRARGALTHRCGTLVPLPPSRLELGPVTWHSPPALDGPTLPPFTAVVAATRAVTETAGLL
jgi:hypothetical protein